MATCGTLTVESQDSGGDEFDPSAVTLPSGACGNPNPQTAMPGETVTVEVDVENGTSNAADVEIIVVDGSGTELARQSATVLAAGSTIPVDFPAPSSAGDYGIEVQLGEVTKAASSFAPASRQGARDPLRSLHR